MWWSYAASAASRRSSASTPYGRSSVRSRLAPSTARITTTPLQGPSGVQSKTAVAVAAPPSSRTTVAEVLDRRVVLRLARRPELHRQLRPRGRVDAQGDAVEPRVHRDYERDVAVQRVALARRRRERLQRLQR